MKPHDPALIHIGTIIEEDSLTLGQLCRACDTHADWVISLVEEGIIEPAGKASLSWRFSGVHLLRVRSALRLQRDLGVNLAGIGLVLDLIAELDLLRVQLNTRGHIRDGA
jgi:chaperone modulatory protein CbpM